MEFVGPTTLRLRMTESDWKAQVAAKSVETPQIPQLT